MSEGVFQTDRAIFNSPVWKNVLKFRLFFYIYGNAVYTEDGIKYSNIHVKRGQLLKSYRKLQEGLEYIENHAVKQYSLSQIKRAIDELVNEGRLTKIDTELGTLFTVCNYEEYQGFERFKKGSIEQRKNTDRTLIEQMKNNNKKDKKDKKDNNIYIGLSENMKNAINDFIEMRKKIRKPMTERAIQIMLKKLDGLAKDETTKIAILEQSTERGWLSVYPLREDKPAQKQPTQATNFKQRTYSDEFYKKIINRF